MNEFKNPLLSVEQAQHFYFNQNKSLISEKSEQELSFSEILEQVDNEKSRNLEVTFSKHANNRLESRNINLSQAQVKRLSEGINQAREKSINESLVMMDNLAFIVSVKNNTVITAIDSNDTTNNVFTNIDGAVIV